MATDPTPFNFGRHEIRIVTLEGEPWFVLVDVCRVLEIDNPTRAASRLDEDEKGLHSVKTPGGEQQMLAVNESGLYSLVLTSRKPQAKAFKKWITSEVIPAIRKNGGYVAGQEKLATGEMSPEEFMARAVLMANSTIAELQAKVAADKPKVNFFERFANADGLYGLQNAGLSLIHI